MELSKKEKKVIKEAQEAVDNWHWNKWVLLVFVILFGSLIYFQESEMRGSEDKAIIYLLIFISTYLINNWVKPVKDSLIIKLYKSKEEK